MVPAAEAPTQGIRAFNTTHLLEPPPSHSAKGASRAVPNLKTRRVPVMTAQGDTKSFDLISYALVFLIVVFAVEAMVAALIW
jgi:hypothetical protein